MTASSEGARRAPFLPEAASRFLRRRTIQLAGLVVLALAGVLALMAIGLVLAFAASPAATGA